MTKKVTKKKKKKKVTKSGKRMGAPTKYKPEYCQMLVEHMAEGLSFDCFGAKVDSPASTVETWSQRHAEFKLAKQEGQVKCREFWEKLGIEGTKGNFKGFNSATWMFNMKNRFRWRNEVVVTDERKVESVTIELPSTGKQNVIDLKEGEGYESS
jgi:transposase